MAARLTTEATTDPIGRSRSDTTVDAFWRLTFRIGFRLALAWWTLRQPEHVGALAAIFVRDRLLLVRASYRRAWTFPGGGVRPGEMPEQALRRELVEEIGLEPRVLVPAGSASGIWDGQRDTVHFFEAHLDRLPELVWDNREIVGARLFHLAELERLSLIGAERAYLASATQGRSGR